jgi:uncharacterized membrane protein
VAVPSGPQLHRASTRTFSVVIIALGVTMLVLTIASGGGPLAKGVLLGLLFVVVGAGRLYLTGRQ